MSARRRAAHGDREPTREEVLDAFRAMLRGIEMPPRATDAEVAEALTRHLRDYEGGSCGPESPGVYLKTVGTWCFCVSWTSPLPFNEEPVLKGRKQFVAAAREAFGIDAPAKEVPLSKAMISALRHLAGAGGEPRPWGGTLDSLERRGLVTRSPGDPFDATLTDAGRERAAEIAGCPCCGFDGPADKRACQVHGADFCRVCKPSCGKQGGCPRAGGGTAIEIPGDRTIGKRAGHFTGQFQDAWRQTVEGIFKAGGVLAMAKAELPAGSWEAWVEADLPISTGTARKLMAIQQDMKLLHLSQRREAPLLPPAWTTLYELSRLEEPEFEALVDGGTIQPEMTRADIRAALARDRHAGGPAALPAPPDGEARYGAILADPPWGFQNYGRGGNDRGADQQYPVMTVAEIGLLPVRDLAADDCLLFLWVTSTHLKDAPGVMEVWGFDLVSTAFVWVKEGGPGLGYWTRKGAEICLLGKRGSPKRQGRDVPEVVHAPRGRHSEKPAEVHARIERLVGGPYIELFARRARPGWDAWGNDPELHQASAGGCHDTGGDP